MKHIYEFWQNNSGGYIDKRYPLCHFVFIEETSEKRAMIKGEKLGMYFDGVENGVDCPCCGDRWSCHPYKVLLTYGPFNKASAKQFESLYGASYYLSKKPDIGKKYEVKFKTIEDKIQFFTDRYGNEDGEVAARLFYSDGTIKEFKVDKKKGKKIRY